MTEESTNSKVSSSEVDEDSSYDSDTDAAAISSPHKNVSRNGSETLAQELDDFNSSPSYRQYLEFALKLGYPERLIQTALSRLGGSPTNNELLAELIKLGAQPGSNACDYGLDIKNTLSGDFSDEYVTTTTSSTEQDAPQLRPIVIDGSNIAMSHGNKEVFSCRGIAIAVDWFRQRGHRDICVFVPKWRKESARSDNLIKDQEILNELEKERVLVYTPSRSLTNGKRMVCYDDRYVLKLALENDGIVVSNDNYRDLVQESSEFKKIVEERILMYSFVNDIFMPPDDPLGKLGPSLESFLRFPNKKSEQICPYGAVKKCTYGNKCKFYHPERGLQPHKSVTERLSDFANYHMQARNQDMINIKKQQVQGKSLSVPINANASSSSTSPVSGGGMNNMENSNFQRHPALCRTSSNAIGGGQKQAPPQHLLPSNMQQQQQPHRLLPGQALSASTSPTNNILPPPLHVQHQHQQFSKSIDSLTHQHGYQMWNQGQQQDLSSQVEDMSINLHKKLHRQLSLLNPFDPRLYQMQNYHNQQQQHYQQNSPGHKPLSNSHSLTGNLSAAAYEHQNVMRIASAPNASNSWQNTSNNSNNCSQNFLPSTSASEPHINWLIPDERRRLHYHLCNIFPKKDVEEAMQMFPNEVDPQKICTAILNIRGLRQAK